MYDESTFQNYIFWLKVKRIFLIVLLTIVGAVVGVVLSQFLVDILLVLSGVFKTIIIVVSTLLFFGISLLITANVGRDVQEGYWKMAVLRKLTVISKKLDALENLDVTNPGQVQAVKKVAKDVKKEISQ